MGTTRKDLSPEQLLFVDRTSSQPVPGSVEELMIFEQLQSEFSKQFQFFFPDHLAEKTIVVIPSLTLDQEVLAKVVGASYYEERLLCLLMLLRMPRTHVIYVSSMPIDPVIIDYYLHLLPGITGYHARERLTLLSCYDSSPVSLTEKILKRCRLMARIKNSIPPGHVAHIACFNTTALERTLAVRLGIPVYGCDPSLNYLGSKSGSRKAFLLAGVPMPPGFEDLRTYEDLVQALARLKEEHPYLKKAVIKLNEGFSGDGNAIIRYPQLLDKNDLVSWLQQNLHHEIKPVAPDLPVVFFLEKFRMMGGIVEAFIEGDTKVSPSVQCRVNPLGEVDIISTHDQELGGDSGQIFLGAYFPADKAYRAEVGTMGKAISTVLKEKGVLGRFGIDFISVWENNAWTHYAIEINLRKGGTTHPYLMMQFLTGGQYNETSGLFETASKHHRYYYATDNLQNNAYRGLTPQDLIDIAMFHGLHFNGVTQKGVMFHMIGALSQYGKIGVVCIGASRQEATFYYRKTIEVLDAETGCKENHLPKTGI